MGIVSLKEFGSLVNSSYDKVKKDAQRGKIIKGTDGKIDTENPINKLYIDNESVKKVVQDVKKKAVPEEKPKETTKKVEKVNTMTKEQRIYSDLDLRKRIAEAELKEREAEIKRMQLEKSAGNLLPLDIIEKVLVINFQAVFKNLDTEIENSCSIWIERLGAKKSDYIEMVKTQREFLAKAIEKAEKDARFEIENAISEHQEIKFGK